MPAHISHTGVGQMERCPETLFREPWRSVWFNLVCVGMEGGSVLVKRSCRKLNMEVSIVRAFSFFFFFKAVQKLSSCLIKGVMQNHC